MLKGLALTPPVLGRISIGKVIEKNGKRLPEKDDQFTITSQVHSKVGWLLHPLNDELRKGQDDKLRSIPVRLLFNEPELNFRADYTLFDRQSGRPLPAAGVAPAWQVNAAKPWNTNFLRRSHSAQRYGHVRSTAICE